MQCRCGETDSKKLTITENAVLCSTCLKLTEENRNHSEPILFNALGTVLWGENWLPKEAFRWMDGSHITMESRERENERNQILHGDTPLPKPSNLAQMIKRIQSQQITIECEIHKEKHH